MDDQRIGKKPTKPITPTNAEGLPYGASGRMMVGLLLLLGLLAFEIFNFDTTRYALLNLLGEVSFAGLRWAAVLAIAFCAIDFAGLIRIFSPTESERTTEAWYLMGAWLLGATMNAVMTWWAVSLTLLNHDIGNEILGRAQLLEVVPMFVAVLVWLTRILFIGAFAVAGDHLVAGLRARTSRTLAQSQPQQNVRQRRPQPVPARPMRHHPAVNPARTAPAAQAVDSVPPFMNESRFADLEDFDDLGVVPTEPNRERVSRIQQRPPIPPMRRRPATSVSARPRQ